MKRKVYISYSRSADSTIIDDLRERAGNENEGWQIEYDKNKLKQGESIQSFMEEITEGDRVLFLLSKQYFSSVYCLHELILTYNKRAADMQPVVVFCEGYSPDKIDDADIVTEWREKAIEAEKEGQRDLSRQCKRFENELSAALAWLLGEFSDSFDGYDRLCICLGSERKKEMEDIFSWLERGYAPRYKHISLAARRSCICSTLKRYRNLSPISGFFTSLLSVRMGENELMIDSSKGDVLSFLSSSLSKEHIGAVVKALAMWFREKKQTFIDSKEIASLEVQTRAVLGTLLLHAVDIAKLHRLTHELNRKGSDACVRLGAGSNKALHQIPVSALKGAQAHFRYDFNPEADDQSRHRISGKHELEMLEKGINVENYIDATQKDKEWMHLCENLYKKMQMTALDQYGGWPSVEGPIDMVEEEIQELSQDIACYFIHFDTHWLESNSNTQKIRHELAKKFPDITQAQSLPDSADNVFLDGLNHRSLLRHIISIYQ